MVLADGGYAYEPDPFNDFSPYEPGQKAIIAWDGEVEIMILSVDVLGSINGRVLHMVPLPSLPSVSLGNISTFNKINEHIRDKGYYSNDGGEGESEGEGEGGYGDGIKIQFHEEIGLHNITVVKIDGSGHFFSWIKDHARNQGFKNLTFLDGTLEVIEHYLNNNIRYFAFDTINLTTKEQSVEPIVYRFRTTYLYFPLIISSIIPGVSEINVVTIVPENLPVNTGIMRELGFSYSLGFRINKTSLEYIDTDIAELITTDGYLNYYEDLFSLKNLDRDVRMERIKNVDWMVTLEDYNYKVEYQDCNYDLNKDLIVFTNSNVRAIDKIDGSSIWDVSIDPGTSVKDIQLLDIVSDEVEEIISVMEYEYQQGSFYYNEYKIASMNPFSGETIWTYNHSIHGKYSHYSGPFKVTDFELDGKMELIFVFDDNLILVLNSENGTEAWNHSIEVSHKGFIIDYTVIDINNDSYPEILLGTEFYITALDGRTGDVLWSQLTNIKVYNHILRSNLVECIYDFDGDGKLEILISPYGYPPSRLNLLNCEDGSMCWWIDFSTSSSSDSRSGSYTGQQLQSPGWSIGDAYIFQDIDNDNILEILCISNKYLYSLNSKTGEIKWDLKIPVIGYRSWCGDFDFYDINSDGNFELILSFNENLLVINTDNGTIIWNKTLNNAYYTPFFKGQIGDFDLDKTPEIIVSYGSQLYSFNSLNGKIEWVLEFKDILSITTIEPADFDYDGKDEVLVYSSFNYYLINCEDGSICWKYFAKNYQYTNFYGLVDIDLDTKPEMIIYDDWGVYFLNSGTGNILWSFQTGERLWDYHQVFDYNSPRKNEMLLFIEEKIYSLKLTQLYLNLNIDHVSATPGDIISIIAQVGYYNTSVSSVNLSITDYGMNGIFSDIDELYPGFYEFSYKVPKTMKNAIKISIDAYHSNYFGISKTIQLHIVQDVTHIEPVEIINPKDELFNVKTIAIPETLAPGESTTILFGLITDQPVSLSGFKIDLSDNNLGGKFSDTSWHSTEYMKFNYLVPDDYKGNTLRILIFLSHEEYRGGIGVVKLNVTGNSELLPPDQTAPVIPAPGSKLGNLSILTNPYPKKITPGEETVIVVYVLDDQKPIINAKIDVFDSGLGGKISTIINHYDGHYSFIYTIPDDIPESISSAILLLYITVDDKQAYFENIEIKVKQKDITEEENDSINDMELNIYIRPPMVLSGESCIVLVTLIDESHTLDLNKISITITDNGKPGRFSYLEKPDVAKFMFEYWVPVNYDGTIKFTAIAYYNGAQIKEESINLEVISNEQYGGSSEDETEKQNKESDNYVTLLYASTIFLIFIVGILIGVFSLYLYATHYRKRKVESEKNEINKDIKKENNKVKKKDTGGHNKLSIKPKPIEIKEVAINKDLTKNINSLKPISNEKK
jgi:hypothetical protein